MLQVRAKALLSKYSDDFFVDHPLYEDKDFAQRVTNAVLPDILKFSTSNFSAAATHELPEKEEQTFFFQMLNFFKKKANDLRPVIQRRPTETRLNEFEKCNHKIEEIRNVIYHYNLRLLFKFLNKRMANYEFSAVIGEATLVAFKAIAKFDWSRGNQFSTYCTWALIKSFRPWEDNFSQSMSGTPVGQILRQADDYDLTGVSDYRDMEATKEAIDRQRVVHTMLDDLGRDESRRNYIHVLKMTYGIGMPKKKGGQICKEIKRTKQSLSNWKRRALNSIKEYAEKNPRVLAAALD